MCGETVVVSNSSINNNNNNNNNSSDNEMEPQSQEIVASGSPAEVPNDPGYILTHDSLCFCRRVRERERERERESERE